MPAQQTTVIDNKHDIKKINVTVKSILNIIIYYITLSKS